MSGRAYARDEDLEVTAPLVLAHRLALSWEARTVEDLPRQIIHQLLEQSAREPL
jgi:MoxR-like ATPase